MSNILMKFEKANKNKIALLFYIWDRESMVISLAKISDFSQ